MKTRHAALAICALAVLAFPASAQKPALDHDAYTIWNRITDEVVSRDGAWLAYRLVPGDGDATLVLEGLDGGVRIEVARGSSPRFSADSEHLVALVEPTEAARDAARAEGGRRSGGGTAPKDSLIVIRLSDGSEVRTADVASFDLPDDAGGWMAFLLDEKGNGEGEGEEEGEGDDDERGAPRLDDGSTLVTRDLGSGEERRFASAVEYEFAADGSALAYTASGDDGAADGVFRMARSGASEALAAGEGRYVQLAVSDDGTVAFLTDRDDRADAAPDFALYASDGGAASPRVVVGAAALPSGWAPSEHGDVTFSGSGGRVYFGTAPAPEPEPVDETPEDERVEVDIWNWKDPLLQPMQLVQLEDELERTYRAMLDLDGDRVVQLATTRIPNVQVSRDGDGDVAMGTSDLPYRQLVSWDGRYVDLYVIDVDDGSARAVAERVRAPASLSPEGSWITRWDGFDRTWYAIDTGSGASVDLTGALGVAFHNALDDRPDAVRPYGSAGWMEGEEAFVVYDEFDVWGVDPSGREAPRNLTEGVGRRTDTRFRVLDLESDDPYVPTGADVYLSSFDPSTKASGFHRDRFDGRAEPVELISGDARFAGLHKADDAEVMLFTRSTFQEFPDLWVADADLDGPRKITDANPQQDDYRWGTAELVEWVSLDGTPLQGILYKPEGFDPAQQYPTMVYFYERSSDGLHGYTIPAAGGSSINRSFYVSRGYVLFVPDIPYRDGYPGESALDAVVPGVLAVADQGFVDRDRIGVQGHSWGGYQIAYMITRTDLFTAAEAGAPVANMISAYGGIRWQSGRSRAVQYERGQSRIGGSLWEYPLRFIENSPIFTADKITTPLLMMHNDEDGAVPWYQGIELFVALRRLGQPVWMLNYNGEAHGLRQEHNRRDWAIRMQQFFDHYLQDAPAPVWMDEGVPAILKGKATGLELTTRRAISEEEPPGR